MVKKTIMVEREGLYKKPAEKISANAVNRPPFH